MSRGWWQWDGRRLEDPAGQEQPKQAEAPPTWPELLERERDQWREDTAKYEQGREIPAAERERLWAEYDVVHAVVDLILAATGRDRNVIGEVRPERVAENALIRSQQLAARLVSIFDQRYEPKAKQPEHDYNMPHTFRPGHAVECPPGCPARLQAPTLERLHAALVAEGIPLVDSLSEALKSEHYRQALAELVATLDDRPFIVEQIVNTANKARLALDNPPAWDGQVRP